MPPETHALLGWLVANSCELPRRDRALITVAGLAPDVDGLGIVADFFWPDPDLPYRWWSEFHHVLAHNGLAALLVSLFTLAVGRKRWLAAALAAVSFHLHLLCDLLGSGGPNSEIWNIRYFWPWAAIPAWSWSGQWRLDGWQNLLITAMAIGVTLWLAMKRGFSPVSIFSEPWDAKVVAVLRHWFSGTAASASAGSASQ